MAGIGFELKKIFKNKGILTKLKAYFFSSVVTIGPMLMCIIMLTFFQIIMGFLGIRFMEREIFVAIITYGFIFSFIVSNFFTLTLTRYISDKIFCEKYDEVLPSLYGALSLVIPLTSIIGIVFLMFSNIEMSYAFGSYILFLILTIIWIQFVYVSGIRNYFEVVKKFILGILVIILGSFILLKYTLINPVISILYMVDLGFIVISFFLMHYLKEYYGSASTSFEFLKYYRKYPSLLFIGIFYTIGIYIHNFIFWKSDLSINIYGNFIYAPRYDVPLFFAMLSATPAMVIYIVKMETSFYEKFRNYYGVIVEGGGIDDISKAKSEMINVLSFELNHIMQLQLIFTMLSLVLGMKFLPLLGMSNLEIDTFVILSLGSFLGICMFIVIIILLYFDNRKGALVTSICFFSTNIIFTIITLYLGESFYGFGYFLSTLITIILGFKILSKYTRNIEYNTFCTQYMFKDNLD